MRVGDETTNDIDHEVGHTAMTGVFNLGDILELINNGFQDTAFAKQELVGQYNQPVFHFGLEASHEMETPLEQLFGQGLREVAFIAKQLAPQPAGQLWHRHAIIDITRCEATGQQLPTIIDHQMQLETKEPIYRVLAALGDILKRAVTRDPTIVADR